MHNWSWGSVQKKNVGGERRDGEWAVMRPHGAFYDTEFDMIVQSICSNVMCGS